MSTGCCNEEQQYFLVTIFAYSGAVLLLWRALVFKPFKLFAVALHEFCHAAAAAALCNRVTGIEVSWDEGGLASYKIPTNRVRCVRAFVLPAGYVGSTCSGCVLVIASAFTVGSQVCGILLAAACAIIAVYAAFGRAASTKERVLLFGVSAAFGVTSAGLTAISFVGEGGGEGGGGGGKGGGGGGETDFDAATWPLELFLLLVGTVNMIYCTYDIYDDTVRRKVERSDAYQFAELYRSLGFQPRCVGFVWFCVALAACVAAVAGHTICVGEGGGGKGSNGPPCIGCLPWWRLAPALALLLCALILRGLDAYGVRVGGCCEAAHRQPSRPVGGAKRAPVAPAS